MNKKELIEAVNKKIIRLGKKEKRYLINQTTRRTRKSRSSTVCCRLV